MNFIEQVNDHDTWTEKTGQELYTANIRSAVNGYITDTNCNYPAPGPYRDQPAMSTTSNALVETKSDERASLVDTKKPSGQTVVAPILSGQTVKAPTGKK